VVAGTHVSWGGSRLATREVIESFQRAPGEVARARRTTAAALRSWGFDGELPAIELAVSELVAHAVRGNGADEAGGPGAAPAGDGQAEMRLSADGDTIRLEVIDPSGGIAALRRAAPSPGRESRGGWGLWFVDEVADDWGVDHRPGRTRVWLVRHCSPGTTPA
jgi:anti-sigma regulatory factor (Ser/Thr protein kinase)